uniref:Uncharacterized protein n=1 Tax=Arundo donax TaxID=35708 RepID=A0A0A9B8W4_ARUDO
MNSSAQMNGVELSLSRTQSLS